MLIPLSKERTLELEETTVPFVMVLSRCKGVDSMLLLQLNDWHGRSDIVQAGLYEKVNAISKKLDMKQTYYRTHVMRNAVWGFDYTGDECVVYYSNEGLSLQVASTMSCKALKDLINELIQRWHK